MSNKNDLLVFKGIMSDLPPEQVERIKAVKASLESVMAGAYEADGYMALAWLGLERSAEDE